MPPAMVDAAPPQLLWSWAVVLLTATIAAWTDVRTGRIPNLLTMPVFLSGVFVAAASGGFPGLTGALGSALLLSFPCFLLFLFAGGGAGDVKLLGALGAWLGFHDALVMLMCVAAAGVLCGMTYAIFRRRSAVLFSNLNRIFGSLAFALSSRRVREATALMPAHESMQPMPYGVAIALGAWLAAGGRWLWQW